MSARAYVPVFSATLLISAFLLFLVQPLFSKMILPLLGGAPSVWNTAMVFFQALLLAGYAYAHVLARFIKKPALQAVIHLVLLGVCALSLPLAIPAGWTPPATANPAFWQLSLMTVAIGGPFFILSASAPLLQHWFAQTDHKDAANPYFLYGASNIGSMAALLLYPVLIEPLFTLKVQSNLWGTGYFVLAALIAGCALLTRKGKAPVHTAPQMDAANDNPPSWKLMSFWLLLAFIPSSLMLGVTTYVTTDIASAPLLWVVPLALYVSTFVVAFARQPMISLKDLFFWQGIALVLTTAIIIAGPTAHALFAIAAHLALFFITALMCHSYLASVRPSAKHLTLFYMIMSTGGVLGGIFNALISPAIFVVPIEYALVLGLSAFLRYRPDPRFSLDGNWQEVRKVLKTGHWKNILKITIYPALTVGSALLLALTILQMDVDSNPFMPMTKALGVLICTVVILVSMIYMFQKRWSFAISSGLVLLIFLGFNLNVGMKPVFRDRNFFGAMKVADYFEERQNQGYRLFIHGTTLHGAQPLSNDKKMVPVTYYYPGISPVSDAFSYLDRKSGKQNIGIIGLGAGSLACYDAPGRSMSFYEIDPDVAKVAENKELFTYLSDCGTPYKIIIGDGRLKIGETPDHDYDLITIDAFSSDNIPIHLLTVDAFKTYFQKIKDGGFLIINISNRHLDLVPVVGAIARELGTEYQTIVKMTLPGDDAKTGLKYTGTIFAVVSRNPDVTDYLRRHHEGWQKIEVPESYRAWTDDYSNLVRALRLAPPVISKTDSDSKKDAAAQDNQP